MIRGLSYNKHTTFELHISYSIAVQYRKLFLHIPWEGKLQTLKNTFDKDTKFS